MKDIGPPYQLGTQQRIAVATVSAATTNAFAASTNLVRVATTTDCYILFGSAPTAAASTSHLMPAGTIDYFLVPGAVKMAAIRVTTDGSLTVTEVSR